MSRRNGCNLTWPQWNEYRGSVLCIELGKDIGLLDNESAGVRGQYSMQLELDVTNTSNEEIDYEFYLLVLNQGTWQISENFARGTLGDLTSEMVLQAQNAPELDWSEFQQISHVRGGNFFGGLRSFVNKVARGVQTGAAVASKILPAVSTVIPALAPVAGAMPMVSAGAALARQLSGGRAVGGRRGAPNRRRGF